jgi:hypothetical protein
MNKEHKEFFANEKEFLAFEFKSKARIIDDKMVEVIAPDGEVFPVLAAIGKYTNEKTRHNQLHIVEYVFDKNFSDNKELMTHNIWNDLLQNGVIYGYEFRRQTRRKNSNWNKNSTNSERKGNRSKRLSKSWQI